MNPFILRLPITGDAAHEDTCAPNRRATRENTIDTLERGVSLWRSQTCGRRIWAVSQTRGMLRGFSPQRGDHEMKNTKLPKFMKRIGVGAMVLMVLSIAS